MFSAQSVDVYTDGSCINNGKLGATASIGVWVEGYPDRSISEPLTVGPQTNQVAELTAIKRALDVVDDFNKINIFTDSRYAMNCVTIWCKRWETNGWKSSKGKPPTNMELIISILDRIRYLESLGKIILFNHVPGHSGNEGNEAAHNLAMAVSRSK